MELARTRLEMAYALAERSPEVAIAEAKAALEDFERLDAARYADAAGALLRSLGAPIRTGPKGFRRPDQARSRGSWSSSARASPTPRLAIASTSPARPWSTTSGNVLSKLGLRNRAEAAGYALRQRNQHVVRGIPRYFRSAELSILQVRLPASRWRNHGQDL